MVPLYRVHVTRPSALARSLAVAFVILSLVAPSALAGPWALYRADLDDAVARTREPDHAVVHEPASGLQGRENRVSYPGNQPGDGTLFLDARLGTRLGVSGGDPVLYADDALVPAGRGDFIVPGNLDLSAWYGWWLDVDSDGIIADKHDARADPDDEFIWRGFGSGEPSIGMMSFTIPGDQFYSISGNHASIFYNPISDHTSRSNADQGWYGASWIRADAATLTTVTTVVVAGAKAVPGSSLRYDLDDPEGLVDVDHYQSLSPDVETLWFAVLRAPWNRDASAVNEVVEAIEGASGIARTDVTALASQAIATALASATPLLDALRDIERAGGDLPSFTPSLGKEPTTEWDDYGGLAEFGGIGDVWGSGNGYDAYAGGYHLFFDNLARVLACAGAEVPAAGTSVAVGPACMNVGSPEHVLASTSGDAKSAGFLLTFEAFVLLWNDKNGDTHIGRVCERTTNGGFDEARNTCESRKHPRPWPHAPTNMHLPSMSEVVDVCGVAEGRGGDITLTPLGGPWPSVMVIRDHRDTGSVTDDGGPETRSDASPIVMRWGDACDVGFDTPGSLDARDAVIFPTGASVAVRVETTVSLARFTNAALGIDIENERITDVDILPATL